MLIFLSFYLLFPFRSLSPVWGMENRFCSGDAVLKFSEKLLEEKDYYRAITEAKRYLTLWPNGPKKVKAMEIMAMAYKGARHFSDALKVYDNLIRIEGNKPLYVKEKAFILEKLERYEESLNWWRFVASISPVMEEESLYHRIWILLNLNNTAMAKKEIESSKHVSSYSKEEMNIFVKDYEALPKKSPFAAAIMAALLPGSGHLYTGRYRDAFTSFIINGLFIWATVESFNEGNDGVGTLLGIIELGWYSGNIYSAYGSAKKFNRRKRKNFLRILVHKMKPQIGLFNNKGDLLIGMKIPF